MSGGLDLKPDVKTLQSLYNQEKIILASEQTDKLMEPNGKSRNKPNCTWKFRPC